MLVCLLVPSTAIRQSLGVAAVLGSCTRHDGLSFDALGPIGTRERATFDCRRRKLEWVPLLAEVIDHLLQTDFARVRSPATRTAKCKQARLRMESASLVVQAKARLLPIRRAEQEQGISRVRAGRHWRHRWQVNAHVRGYA